MYERRSSSAAAEHRRRGREEGKERERDVVRDGKQQQGKSIMKRDLRTE
jgi:hypothetical protein